MNDRLQYRMIQFLMISFTVLEVVTQYVDTPLNNIDYLSVLTNTASLPCNVFRSGPRMFIATNANVPLPILGGTVADQVAGCSRFHVNHH